MVQPNKGSVLQRRQSVLRPFVNAFGPGNMCGAEVPKRLCVDYGTPYRRYQKIEMCLNLSKLYLPSLYSRMCVCVSNSFGLLYWNNWDKRGWPVADQWSEAKKAKLKETIVTKYTPWSPIETVNFPIKDGGSFHSYIKLPGDSMALGDFHGINGLPRHADYWGISSSGLSCCVLSALRKPAAWQIFQQPDR